MVQAMVAEMKSKQAKAVEEAVAQKHKVVLAGWLVQWVGCCSLMHDAWQHTQHSSSMVWCGWWRAVMMCMCGRA